MDNGIKSVLSNKLRRLTIDVVVLQAENEYVCEQRESGQFATVISIHLFTNWSKNNAA